MARITCFIDTPALAQQLRQLFDHGSYHLQLVSASHLDLALRDAVQQFAPDLVLLELAQSIDNPHIFFFLRSDCVTRNTPIMVFSNSIHLAEEARILGADGHLPRNFALAQLRAQIKQLLGSKFAAHAA